MNSLGCGEPIRLNYVKFLRQTQNVRYVTHYVDRDKNIPLTV